MAIHTGLEINDVISLRIGFILQHSIILHNYSVAALCCCGVLLSLGIIEGVGSGNFLEHCAAFEYLLRIIALPFA